MSLDAWITLATVTITLILLVATKLPPDLTLLSSMTVLLALGILDLDDALAGFSNPGLITVATLFIIVQGLRETGAVSFFGQIILGHPRTILHAQIRLILPVAMLSAFMNNTPLVAMFIPVVSGWAKRFRLPLAQLFIPLSYAAILGGVCTLIGTSTNLVVNGLLIKALDKAHANVQSGGVISLPLADFARNGMGFFDITLVGLPMCLLGIVFMIVFGRRLLPHGCPPFGEVIDPREYTIEMLVTEESPVVGKTIEEAGLRHLNNVYLIEIVRAGRIIAAVSPQEKLSVGDQLIFVGIVESIADLLKIRGLQPATTQMFKLGSPRSEHCLVEAVISNSFPSLGQTVRDSRFRMQYDAAIVAITRNGERVKGKIGDIELTAGDCLLLEAHPSFISQQRYSRNFFLVSGVENSAPPRHERAWLAVSILIAIIVFVAFGFIDMLKASLIGAVLMLVSGCITATNARESIEWPVIFAIIGALGLGQAISSTGLADTIAYTVIKTGGGNPWLVLALVYLITTTFTEIITNNAAAALVFPIALGSAEQLGVHFMPFVIAIMIGASMSFATPIGYQTNLMVMGPGGYRFSDYLKIGIPLNVAIGLGCVAITPLLFPF